MSDRLDIDALLIGSLYGELSSTDEARLQAHLESHPADRTALADLTRARTAVRESRIFELQAEPPQSISALLMQEAAKRAPKKAPEPRESWFQRFLASLRHPAMAAAAMLVVVVGVAGTIYMKKGDQFAEQTKSESVAPASQTETETALAPAAPDLESTTPPTGAADFNVRLEESTTDGVAAPAKQDRVGGLEVSTSPRRPMPKELPADEKKDETQSKAQRKFSAPPTPTVTAPGMVPEGAKGRAPAEPSPASPPPPPTSNYGAGGGATGTSRGATDKATASRAPTNVSPAPAQEQQKETVEVAWAKAQHVKIVDRVRAGKCGEAANLAVQLSNRVPAYYQQYVENDRDLKQCFTVINRERELDAERAQRARAKQRADEPTPRPAESSK